MDHETSTLDVKSWRKAKRAELMKARLQLDHEAHQQLSLQILKLLIDNFQGYCAGSVGMFWPFRGEVDILPFADQVRAWGGSVSLPVVVAKGQPLEFHTWNAGDRLEGGALGIPVPASGAVVQPQTLVIPLLGFDSECYRLGYGAGYYDRTLEAACPRPISIGVGFELSRLETVYPQPHDVAMEFVVTEHGVQQKA